MSNQNSDLVRVAVTDVDISFRKMVGLVVKLSLAMIPAALALAVTAGGALAVLSAMAKG